MPSAASIDAGTGENPLPGPVPLCRGLLPQSEHSVGRRVRFRFDARRTIGRRPRPRPFCYCPATSGGAPPRTLPRTPPVVPGRWHPRWNDCGHQSCAGPSEGAAPVAWSRTEHLQMQAIRTWIAPLAPTPWPPQNQIVTERKRRMTSTRLQPSTPTRC